MFTTILKYKLTKHFEKHQNVKCVVDMFDKVFSFVNKFKKSNFSSVEG